MQFSIVAVLSFAASVLAQSQIVGFNSVPQPITVGVPVDVTYHAPGPITITLRQGPKNNLSKGVVLASGITGGTYHWTPTTGGSSFALYIQYGSEDNYSSLFNIDGGSSSVSSSSSPSSSSAATYGNKVATTTTPSPVHNTPNPGFNYPPRLNTTYSAQSTLGVPAAPSGSANPAPYPVPVPARNSTTATPAMPSQTGSSAPITSAPASGAAQLGSSFALVVGFFAAFAYLA